jgi:hypothetical protein
MKKPAIPSVITISDKSIAAIIGPLKENVEILTGVREGVIEQLPTDATLTAAVAKINEIIVRLNAYE